MINFLTSLIENQKQTLTSIQDIETRLRESILDTCIILEEYKQNVIQSEPMFYIPEFNDPFSDEDSVKQVGL